MRKIFGLLAITTIILTACAAQKKTATTNDVSYVQMWRTACFGKCPNYKIEVYDNGLVRYTGNQFTDTGIYEKNIGVAEAKKLLNMFTEKRVDTLQKQYQMLVADLPGIVYTFRYGNTEKQILNANFGPLFLRELANKLDRLVKAEGANTPQIDKTWKKISDSPKGD